MAFAGLWNGWKDPATGQWRQSYTIITTDPNELMAPVHNRIPVILLPVDSLSRSIGFESLRGNQQNLFKNYCVSVISRR